MRRAAQIASFVALAGTIVPALLFFADQMDLDRVKTWMLASTFLWFVATPLWMERKRES